MLPQNESYYNEPLKNEPIMDVFKNVVNYESIYERIEKASPNVKTYEIQPDYAKIRGKRTLIGNNIDDLVMHITDICKLPDRKFILAYCDNPDSLLHKFGTNSQEVKDFVTHTENKIEEMCNSFDDDTILIVSSDHGHKDIDKVYNLLDYPEIQECLIMPPSFETRALTFWVKDEMRNQFVDRFNNNFKDEFWLMTKEEFLDKYHFLGYGVKHYKIDDFVGNYIALSVKGSIIKLGTFLVEDKSVKKSTHCGLTKEEMEVPVIVFN